MVKLKLDYILDETIEESIVDQTRWSVIKRHIVPFDDRFYEVFVSWPATESQGSISDENDEEIECSEVKLVERTVKVWE